MLPVVGQPVVNRKMDNNNKTLIIVDIKPITYWNLKLSIIIIFSCFSESFSLGLPFVRKCGKINCVREQDWGGL
jgi:hypothetical protein